MLYSLDTTPEGLHPLVSSSLCGNMASTCSCAHIIHTHNAHTHTHTWMHPCRHWAHVWLWVHICTLQWPFWQQTRHFFFSPLPAPPPCPPPSSGPFPFWFFFFVFVLLNCRKHRSFQRRESGLQNKEDIRVCLYKPLSLAPFLSTIIL